jgi:hypothetical protein
MIEKITADAKRGAEKIEPRTLIMCPNPRHRGCWRPMLPCDRELLADLLALPRPTDADWVSGRALASLVNACADRGITIGFHPNTSRFRPPSPAPAQGRAPRKSKSPKVAKLPDR